MSMKSSTNIRNANANGAANIVQKLVDNTVSGPYYTDIEQGERKMASSKMFTIAGTSDLNGIKTFRFATGTIAKRKWVLEHNGHTKVALVELPNEMDKLGAIAWLQAQGIGNGAVLPNAPKTAKVAAEVVPVKTVEELAAEAKAQKAAEFKLRMAEAKARKAAERAAVEEAQDETPVVESTELEMSAIDLMML